MYVDVQARSDLTSPLPILGVCLCVCVCVPHPQALRQHKTEMAESQAALISQMRLQQQAAMQQGLPPGAGALPPGAPQLPPGLDPSMFPPGFFGPDGLPAEEYAQGYQ